MSDGLGDVDQCEDAAEAEHPNDSIAVAAQDRAASKASSGLDRFVCRWIKPRRERQHVLFVSRGFQRSKNRRWFNSTTKLTALPWGHFSNRTSTQKSGYLLLFGAVALPVNWAITAPYVDCTSLLSSAFRRVENDPAPAGVKYIRIVSVPPGAIVKVLAP